jgi:hypothetical protein
VKSTLPSSKKKAAISSPLSQLGWVAHKNRGIVRILSVTPSFLKMRRSSFVPLMAVLSASPENSGFFEKPYMASNEAQNTGTTNYVRPCQPSNPALMIPVYSLAQSLMANPHFTLASTSMTSHISPPINYSLTKLRRLLNTSWIKSST